MIWTVSSDIMWSITETSIFEAEAASPSHLRISMN